ncbi:reverse transcriptase [Phytophthora megakarya]|uniref:RNA-directed DNA polymerase n=1 Tax=Phytophthora megakarya TaxID=4795 RepID=A0A225WXB3_9STRA|nr:reverse transcriptase [Phytophthora megakarya]
MSQSELEISEMEKRFYFQNGLRAETAKKVKEFIGKSQYGSSHFEAIYKLQTTPRESEIVDGSENTSKGAGSYQTQCKSTKETNHYVSVSFYVILEVSAWASKQSELPTAVSSFVDNGSSLNGVIEELANQLQLDIIEHPHNLMTVMLGYNQAVQRPKRTVEMKLQIPNFPETCEAFTVMPVPEGKDVVLGMKWLQENNPDIDREQLRKGKCAEAVFAVNPHDSEKAERFNQQGWDALVENPAYEALVKYRDTVFRTELPSSTPPDREGIEHEIQLYPGAQSISVKQWRQSPKQRKVIQDWTKEMVQAGIIRPSTSAFCAPTFCVKNRLGGALSTIIANVTVQLFLPATSMPRKEDTYSITAFSTPNGLFEYLVTPMGLSGSLGTFNRLIQRVFSDLHDVMRIYFDDIYVYTQDQDVQKHVDALERVLMRYQEQQLYVKLSKCQICAKEIPCLGDFVGRNGVRMVPDKVRIIKEWPVPRTKKQMESVFGYDSFAGPLHESTKGLRPKETLHLTDHQLKCFDELKRRLSTLLVLQLPDFDKSFAIRMDASNFAIGGVLFQNEGGLEHPMAYTGRKMKPVELNYAVREQELLAIMHAPRVWRVYLLDRPFTFETDHKSIETILTQKTTNRRVARWFNELAEFHPQFKWIPGDSNQVSLSELIEAARNREIVASIQTTSVTVAHSAKQLYSTDIRVQKILQSIGSGKEVPRYSVNNGVLYYQTRDGVNSRLVIPDNEDMKNRIICENHDVVTAGHPGYFKTYLGVQKKHYWLKISKYIQRYVNICELCQRNKARQTKPPGLLQPLEILEGLIFRWPS